MIAVGRVRLGDLQYFVAWVVAAWAALHVFAPEASTAAVLSGLALLGAFAGATPVRLRAGRPRLSEALLGAIALPAAVYLLQVCLVLAAGGAEPRGWLRYAPWLGLAVVLLLDLPALGRLKRLLGVEWLKLRRGNLFRLGLLITTVATLFAAWTHEELPGSGGWTLAADALGIGLWSAEVFVLVLGATALSGEASSGTLKMMLPHAYRRSDWIVAKGAVLLIAALCFLVVVAAVSLGYAEVTKGLDDVTRELEPIFGEETGTTETFATADVMRSHFQDTLLASLAALAATALLGLFLSALFDSVVASLCAAFLVFAGLRFADVLLGLSRDALRAIYAWYPDQLRVLTEKLGRALNERWDDALLPAGLNLALLTGALAVLLAVRVFARRDLHA